MRTDLQQDVQVNGIVLKARDTPSERISDLFLVCDLWSEFLGASRAPCSPRARRADSTSRTLFSAQLLIHLTLNVVQQYCTTCVTPSVEFVFTIGMRGDGAHDHTACSGLSAEKQMGTSGYGGVDSARVRVVVRESSAGRGGCDFGWEVDFGGLLVPVDLEG